MKAFAGVVLLVVGLRGDARADIVLSAAGLNSTLKTMDRLKQQIETGTNAQRDEALFQTGVQADRLTSLVNEEIASHGMQERELIDLALSRTKELGITITYNREKKKFFYDGAAFAQYLKAAPEGTHAAAAEFTLISYQFYMSTGRDMTALGGAAERKQRFLARYPRFKQNAELRLYLAIDYRDLYRAAIDDGDAVVAEKYRLLTRGEYERIARQYPRTEQADTARKLLRRFDEETPK